VPPSNRACRLRSLLFACCTAATAIGCDAAGDPSGDHESLDGRTFLLESSEGFTPVSDTTLRVHFSGEDGQPTFGFHAGCNHHSGPYQVRDGRLVLEGLGSTAIGCEQPLSDQDSFLASFFTAGPALQLDGDRLTFTGDSATLVFLDREMADPDRPLTGRLWTIDTFISGDGASSLALDPPPTVRFEQDGTTIDVFSGCNSASGTFTQTSGELTLRGLGYTERGCPEPNAMMAEAHVQAVLTDGIVRLEIEASRLTLMRGERGLAATTD